MFSRKSGALVCGKRAEAFGRLLAKSGRARAESRRHRPTSGQVRLGYAEFDESSTEIDLGPRSDQLCGEFDLWLGPSFVPTRGEALASSTPSCVLGHPRRRNDGWTASGEHPRSIRLGKRRRGSSGSLFLMDTRCPEGTGSLGISLRNGRSGLALGGTVSPPAPICSKKFMLRASNRSAGPVRDLQSRLLRQHRRLWFQAS